MFPRVIWYLHDVQFEASVALAYGVDAGDVWTLLTHRLHELNGQKEVKTSEGLNLESICKLLTVWVKPPASTLWEGKLLIVWFLTFLISL